MSIRFQCPECEKSYEVADAAAGKSAKCKNCGTQITVPTVDISPTPSGTEVLRHKKAAPFKAVKGGGKHLTEIEAHIRRFVDEPEFVWHELVSDKVHLDVHVVKPSKKYPWHTLITSGMSDKPMNAPDGAEDERFAEMVLCLPAEWDVSERGFKSLDNFWPLKWLKQVARLPHDFDTWISVGHTIPNGDPPEPFHPSTSACCWLILSPVWFSDEFRELRLKSGEKIKFLSIVPLYAEEMNYKLERGTEKLADQLGNLKLTDLMRFDRPNVCAGGSLHRAKLWLRGHRWTTGAAVVLAIAFFYALATGQIRPPALENRGGAPPGGERRANVRDQFGGGVAPPRPNGAIPGQAPSIDDRRAEHEKRVEEMRARASERMDSRRGEEGELTSRQPPPLAPSPRTGEGDIVPPEGGTTSGDEVGDTDWTPVVGDEVEALWGRKWWKASVIEIPEAGKFKVHYDGYADSFDEVVPRDRVRQP